MGGPLPLQRKRNQTSVREVTECSSRGGPWRLFNPRFILYMGWRKEAETRGRTCLGHIASRNSVELKLDCLLPVDGSCLFANGRCPRGSIRLPSLASGPPLGLAPSVGCSSQMLTHHFSPPNPDHFTEPISNTITVWTASRISIGLDQCPALIHVIYFGK